MKNHVFLFSQLEPGKQPLLQNSVMMPQSMQMGLEEHFQPTKLENSLQILKRHSHKWGAHLPGFLSGFPHNLEGMDDSFLVISSWEWGHLIKSSNAAQKCYEVITHNQQMCLITMFLELEMAIFFPKKVKGSEKVLTLVLQCFGFWFIVGNHLNTIYP